MRAPAACEGCASCIREPASDKGSDAGEEESASGPAKCHHDEMSDSLSEADAFAESVDVEMSVGRSIVCCGCNALAYAFRCG